MVKTLPSQDIDLFCNLAVTVEALQTEAYVIGGYVRDHILGRPSKDIDIVCVDDGIVLAREYAKAHNILHELKTYSQFGVAMIKIGDYEIEFVSARKESYTQDSRKPKVEKGSISDDQLRRDFTINALAISLTEILKKKEAHIIDAQSNPLGFDVIDPFGGIEDLSKKIIRTPTDPDKTFSDDPLRMMRAVRFASQLNFEIQPSTKESIKKNAHRIDIVSKERISIELNKIMASKQPSIGLSLMEDLDLMKRILPEMSIMNEVDIKNGKGHKNNFYHTLEVIDNVAENSDHLWLRWAALMHDIGKPRTKRFEESVGWTFHGHEVVGERMVKQIFRRLKLPLDHKMKFVSKLVRLHLRPIALVNENTTDSAIRRLLYEAGEDIDQLMLLCEADITSKNKDKVNRYLQNYVEVRRRINEVEARDKLRNWHPPIDGAIIMKTFNLKPCKTVGVIKTAIREAILDGDIENTFDAAYTFMIEQGKILGLEPIN
ncbi:CCA tRNA nucleotidyltransferase [Membranihabitans marinus]|uniref:CCA tRNA nucleotidyltransferase n=1 Tax=Membranihabitans marinus TaxID=1227546 RepID=UPI00374CF680